MTIAADKQPVEWMTAKEVMAKIRFGRTALYRMIRDEGFPAPIKMGFASRWSKAAVEAWMMGKQGDEAVHS